MTYHKIEKNILFYVPHRNKHDGYEKITSSYVMRISTKIRLFFFKFAIYRVQT